MSHRFKVCSFLAIALAIASCAPHDPSGNKGRDQGAPTDKVVDPPKQVELPAALRDRVDAALDNVRNRDLLPEHGFWTFFHAILGVGPEHAQFRNTKTGKRMKALDYICDGGEVRGMVFER